MSPALEAIDRQPRLDGVADAVRPAVRDGASARRAGIGLSLLGYAIASMSAYLGGHLVFGEGVGVAPGRVEGPERVIHEGP